MKLGASVREAIRRGRTIEKSREMGTCICPVDLRVMVDCRGHKCHLCQQVITDVWYDVWNSTESNTLPSETRPAE